MPITTRAARKRSLEDVVDDDVEITHIKLIPRRKKYNRTRVQIELLGYE